MIRQTHSRSTASLLLFGTLGAFATTSALAGPRVGSTVGVPSTATTTVQARVISSTPVVAQVAVPRESCYDEVRTDAARPSGAGAIIGAIAGAALGNAVGKGSGRAVATGVGLIGGAVLGNHIETDGKSGRTRTERRCEQQTVYENQVVAYSVVYEVGGQRYTTQLPHEPGSTLPVQLTVSPTVVAPPPVAAPVAPVVYVPPPSPVIYTSAPRWQGADVERCDPPPRERHPRRHREERHWY